MDEIIELSYELYRVKTKAALIAELKRDFKQVEKEKT